MEKSAASRPETIKIQLLYSNTSNEYTGTEGRNGAGPVAGIR